MSQNPKQEQYRRLREAAEAALAKVRGREGLRADELELALQELQVHQIELEMQNDELFLANEQAELERLKFENIYDLAPVGYFILDGKGVIEDVNDAGLALLEAAKSIVRGRPLRQFVITEQADEFYRFYQVVINSTDKQRCQLRFRSKKGREFHALVEARRTVQGKCYIALIDVTEGRESRQRLAETNDRLQLALDASDAGTWELEVPSMRFNLDERNRVLCNAIAGGFKDTYASFLALVHPDDVYNVDQSFRTAINTQSDIDLVARFTNADGELCYASLRGHHIPPGPASEMHFTGIIWNITEKKRQEELQQKAIVAATLKAEERERKRISEALHDSVSQLLYGIRIHLSQLDDRNIREGKKKLEELLQQAIRETRNISYELAPQTLADLGLEGTVRELCERLSGPQLHISAIFTGVEEQTDLVLNTTIYRIVQELINNAMKHGKAGRIHVTVKKQQDLVITVSDNGKGFDVKQQRQRPQGTGLASLRNRAHIYNGELGITSGPGEGTTVTVILRY